MKVLWIEGQAPVRENLAIAADKAARRRIRLDLVTAPNLLLAEARLRLERFDLVLIDLSLPDALDADMAIARLANIGQHRLAVVTTDRLRPKALAAVRCGCNISPDPVDRAGFNFNRYIQRPDTLLDMFADLMGSQAAAA